MIEARVSLNDEVYELLVPSNAYNGDLPDYTAAVNAALGVRRLRYQSHNLDHVSLVVKVERLQADVATHAGAEPDPETLSEGGPDELDALEELAQEFVEDYQEDPEED